MRRQSCAIILAGLSIFSFTLSCLAGSQTTGFSKTAKRRTISSTEPDTEENDSIRAQALLARSSNESCQVYIDTSSLPCPTVYNVGSRVLTQEDVNGIFQDAVGLNDADIAAYTKMFGKSPLVSFYHPNRLDESGAFAEECERAHALYESSNRNATKTFLYPIDQATCHQIKAFADARHDVKDSHRALNFVANNTGPSVLIRVELAPSMELRSPEKLYTQVMEKLGLEPEVIALLQKAPSATEISDAQSEGIDANQIPNWITQFHESFVNSSPSAPWKGEGDGPLFRISIPVVSDGKPLTLVLQQLAMKRMDNDTDEKLKEQWAKADSSHSPAMMSFLSTVSPTAFKAYMKLPQFLDLCVKPVGTGLEETKLKAEYLFGAGMVFGSSEQDHLKMDDWFNQLNETARELSTKGDIQKNSHCYALARGAGDMGSKMLAGFLMGLMNPVAGIVGGSTLFALDSAGESAEKASLEGAGSGEISINTMENMFVEENLYTAMSLVGNKVAGTAGAAATESVSEAATDAVSKLGPSVAQSIVNGTKKKIAETLAACGQMVFISVVGNELELHPDNSMGSLWATTKQSCEQGAIFQIGGEAVGAGIHGIAKGATLYSKRGQLTVTSVDARQDLVVAKGSDGKPVEYKLSALTKLGQPGDSKSSAQENIADARARMQQGIYREGDHFKDSQTGEVYQVIGVKADPLTGKNQYAAILGNGSDGKKYQFNQASLSGGKSRLIYGGRDLVQLSQHVAEAQARSANSDSADTESTPQRAAHDSAFKIVRDQAVSHLQAIVDALNWKKKYKLAADDNLLVEHVVDGLSPQEVSWLEDKLETDKGQKEVQEELQSEGVGVCFYGGGTAKNDWDTQGKFRGVLYALNENDCRMDL
jgi:hypothetical protein